MITFWLGTASCLTGCALPFTVVSPLAVYEHSQVYQPVKWPKGNWDKKAEIKAENAWFLAEDGTQLHGWYLPHENPVAVALFAHGNSGNVSDQAETLKMLRDKHRLSIMTFDYRGYGRSEGAPHEAGILQDARAARRWLAIREKILEEDIVLVGHSLGGGVMVNLAAKDGARGLILASTFTSVPDVAKFYAPLFPADSLIENRFDSERIIGEYHGPLLQIHGERDKVVPYKLGRKLFEAANQPKVFLTKSDAGHNDPMSSEERAAFDTFLASLPSLDAPPESADGDNPPLAQANPQNHLTSRVMSVTGNDELPE
jgi:pimeloyl-ACP methyl ester carboxylesterase